MANVRRGGECCDNPVSSRATCKCKCGCGLNYCRGCWVEHWSRIGGLLWEAMSVPRRERIIETEIVHQREAASE